MAREAVASPQPPRHTGNLKEDNYNLFKWLNDWFRVRVIQQRTTARMDSIKAIEPLTQTISSSPTQAEVQAIQAKINEIISAAQ